MQLYSLVLAIQAEADSLPDKAWGSPPKWWARAVHAFLLQAVHGYNPDLAEKLHADSTLRPFTVSSLYGYSAKYGIQPERVYSFRITTLNDELYRFLISAKEGALALGAKIELDRRFFIIKKRSFDDKNSDKETLRFDWAEKSSYEALSAPYLSARKKAPKRIQLNFLSPVAFKSAGKHLPIPLPSLVFGSLLNRWNAFAPLTFPDEVKRYAEECLVISRFSLSSRAIHTKAGAVRVGGVGKVSYTAVHYDPYWMSIVALLADYALFSGVGSGINLGMGQARRLLTA